jgi:dTDP-4-dehydrorhamnose 3,5-epimerase
MIEGLVVTPLRQISDERGKVMHMLREDSPIFTRFGEIYFSCVYPGAVKAWHLHKRMTRNYAVIIGEIKLVLYDDRPGSRTRGVVEQLNLSPDNYRLVTIPPLLWSGFQGIRGEMSVLANCATLPHDASEVERKAPSDPSIPYDWGMQHG